MGAEVSWDGQTIGRRQRERERVAAVVELR